MKLILLSLVTLISVSASAQVVGDLRDYDGGGRDRHGRGRDDRWGRGVHCRITTTNYNIYEARGRTCRDAQENVIRECVIGQKRRGVSNWDRCEHSIRPGRKYTMRCTDGCGY